MSITKTKRAVSYIVYRHGSNSKNQSMCDCMPVAIVEASSRAVACRTEGPDQPRIDLPTCWLVANPDVECWVNQYFSATPCSRAPRADIREVEEWTP
jgi:hypothetical protein